MTFRRSTRSVRTSRFALERLEPRCVLSASNAAAMFQMRLEVVDLEGTPVQQVEVGAEFDVRLLAQDLRTEPGAKGLFAAYADVVYRDALVSPVAADKSSVRFDGEYQSGRNVEFTRAGLINELGAVAGISPTGSDEMVVATVRFRADAAGVTRFGLDAADDELMHPVLAYGLNDTMTAETTFVGTSLRIVGANGETVADDGWIPAEDHSVGLRNYVDSTASKGKEPTRSVPPPQEDAVKIEKRREVQRQLEELAKQLVHDVANPGMVFWGPNSLIDGSVPAENVLFVHGKAISFANAPINVTALPHDRWLSPSRLAPSFPMNRAHSGWMTNDAGRDGMEFHAEIMASARDRIDAIWHESGTLVGTHRGSESSQVDGTESAVAELATSWNVGWQQLS